MPLVALITLPPKRVTLEAHWRHGSPVPPLTDPSESFIQPYGWKTHVSPSRMDGS